MTRVVAPLALLLLAAGCPSRAYYARCGSETTVDLRSDPAHCGRCRTCCAAGTSCVDGACVSCPEGAPCVGGGCGPAEPGPDEEFREETP